MFHPGGTVLYEPTTRRMRLAMPFLRLVMRSTGGLPLWTPGEVAAMQGGEQSRAAWLAHVEAVRRDHVYEPGQPIEARA